MAVAAVGIAWYLLGEGRFSTTKYSELGTAMFVGSATCAGCHRAEAALWNASQHKHAMDHATETTVLGDFGDSTFDYFGVRSRFFRKGEKFLVETDGSDGKLATYEIKYTFGIDPLQQYLIEFSDGRLQALSIAWDSRPKNNGGQRWFHLYPNEPIKHDDPLHWTRPSQNWNFMCAECHSTGVRKNYDAAADRFATTWTEISVGCEACHGQGSRHVDWARERHSWWSFGRHEDPAKGLLAFINERSSTTWTIDPKTGNAKRGSAPPPLRKEVETCGRCHARRGTLSEDWVPGRWLSDTHAVTPITREHFAADGQMRDDEEVYNYSQFKQSKMFAAGVTCSNCHDPHSAKLRAEGNGVCLQCHATDKYEAANHHQHAKAEPPLSCASCHMPSRTYMVVDRRHDHGFRIPRPDLTETLDVPNACNDCHRDKSAAWAAAAIEGWRGPSRRGFDYAGAFHAAWRNEPDAAQRLRAAAADANNPTVVRGSAASELGSQAAPPNVTLARILLSDSDPMVRIGALDMLERAPVTQVWPLASPLLSDSTRGVRIRAVSLLAGMPDWQIPKAHRARFERAAAELIAAHRLNADRPAARVALGLFYARRGRTAEAEQEYRTALRLSPQYTIAAVNLADLYRALGRDAEGEAVLRTALAVSPRDAAAHYGLGLLLVRMKRLPEALESLGRATEYAPGDPRYAYAYAVALQTVGRSDDAIATLKLSLERHPNDRDTLVALVTFNRDGGNIEVAVMYAEQLVRMLPGDEALRRLIEDLRRRLPGRGN